MKLSSVFLLCCLSLSAYADSADQKLAALINGVNSFSAHFKQTVQSGGNNKEQVSEGAFQLQRPGKFRWDTQKPFHQTMIATGKELWIYESDIGSASVSDMEQGLGSTPALLLSSSAQELNNSFTITEPVANQFKLLPKGGSNNFEEILLVFDKSYLSELLLADTLGNKTRVVFSGIKLNEKMPADLFAFSPAKDVDVIDNRAKKKP